MWNKKVVGLVLKGIMIRVKRVGCKKSIPFRLKLLKGAEHKKSLPNSHDCLRCVPLPLHLSRTLWNPYRWWVPMYTRNAPPEFWIDSSTFPTKRTSVRPMTLKGTFFPQTVGNYCCWAHLHSLFFSTISVARLLLHTFHCVASVHL